MNCFLCGESSWQNLNKDYVICADCGLIKVKTICDSKLYLFENYSAYQCENGYLPFHLKFNSDYQIANSRIKRLISHISAGSLIDIGAGSGAFVKCANDNNFRAIGYEVDWLVAAIASRMSKCYITSIIGTEFYDVVTIFDVLEHLENPLQIPDGNYLYIELPIYNGDTNWKHFKPKEHIWCFTLNTIKLYADKINYNILEMFTPISLEGKVLDSKAGLVMRKK